MILALLRIPCQPFQQRVRQGAGQGMRFDHAGETAVDRRVERLARIGAVQPLLQVQHGLNGGFSLIHRVIGQPTKGVQHQRRVAHLRGQQFRRRMKRQRARADRRAAFGQIAFGAHSAAMGKGGAIGRGASGTSWPITSAVPITPGTPAPGWVPAPAK